MTELRKLATAIIAVWQIACAVHSIQGRMLLQIMREQAPMAVYDLLLFFTCCNFSLRKTNMSVECTHISGNFEKRFSKMKTLKRVSTSTDANAQANAIAPCSLCRRCSFCFIKLWVRLFVTGTGSWFLTLWLRRHVSFKNEETKIFFNCFLHFLFLFSRLFCFLMIFTCVLSVLP